MKTTTKKGKGTYKVTPKLGKKGKNPKRWA